MQNKIIALAVCMMTCMQVIAMQQDQRMNQNQYLKNNNVVSYGYYAYIKPKIGYCTQELKKFYKAYFPTIVQNNPLISSLLTVTVAAGGWWVWSRYSSYFDKLRQEEQLKKKQLEDIKLINEIYDLPVAPEDYPCARSFTETLFLDALEKGKKILEDKQRNATWCDGEGKIISHFVRKLILPIDAVIQFRGDLHGDVHSLISWLKVLREAGWFEKDNPFRLTKESIDKHRYLAFLGDYVDRGHYGAEVMWMIMRLLIENPNNVLIVRGNHENIWQNESFRYELHKKFGFEDPRKNSEQINDENSISINKMYFLLPVAIFLGCENEKGGVDFIQCCHGGMGLDHDTSELLDSKESDVYQLLSNFNDKQKMNRICKRSPDLKEELSKLCLLVPAYNDYMWNDFDFKNENPDCLILSFGRSWTVCKKYTDYILKTATKKGSKDKLFAVFRAHQHDSKTISHIIQYGNGVYKHWSKKTKEKEQWFGEQNQQWSGKDGDWVPVEKYSVWTFNVAPRTGYYEHASKEFNYDTVAELRLAKGFDNWKLYPRKIPVNKDKDKTN